MKILVINAGSSSLKYQLIDTDSGLPIAKGLCERIGIEGSLLKHTPNGGSVVLVEKPMENHSDAIKMVVDALVSSEHGVIKSMDEISAVGHRVVHGGESFSSSAIITDDIMKVLNECVELAPLHNPPNITGIEACASIMPKTPQVAVFDTAFHQTMPKTSYIYSIPYEYYEKYKIRRYGFHGTSHRYVSQNAAQMLGKPIEDLKIVTLHLGNGSSICAVKNGKSYDTSMGFTPLEGLPMGTRSGSLDPAIVFYLMEKEGLGVKEISDRLNKKAGILGISGVSSDFRDVNDAADAGNERAQLALNLFEQSAKRYIGAYAAAMGGLDAVVFTAGVGENSRDVRYNIVSDLEFLGISIDKEKNDTCKGNADISTADAKVRTLVVPTNEELMIAMETRELIEA